MKKILTLFAALVLLAVGATAQKLSYSAVVRNSDNELQANKTLTVTISIANSINGDVIYGETHNGVQTNQNGLLTLTIGDNPNHTGDMSAVTWATAYITTDITLPDGAHVLNTTPVTAVPFALYAETAGNGGGIVDETDPVFTAWSKDYNDLTNTPPIPTVNDGTLTIKQGDNTLGTFTANQSGTTEVNIPTAPAVPVVNDGVLTIQKNGTTVGTFSANQSTPVTVNITITPQDIIDAVGQMTDEQKSALCSALNCGGGETPTSVDGQPCPGTPTVTDHEGNVYNTVQIGDQCWTKENMRVTTSPSTGTYLIPAVNTDNTYTGKQARWYDNDSVTYAPKNYGLMYNWNAAVDTFNTTYGETSVNTDQDNKVSVTFTGHRRGICPEGWHVPSHAEWTDLTNYLNSCSNEAGQYKYRCGQQEGYIAKALASTTGWNTDEATEDYPCQLRYNPATTNNASGFGAIPAGRIDEIGFNRASGAAYFWSATQNLSNYPYVRDLNGASPNVFVTTYSSERSCSVRCLKDETSGGGGGGETPTTETCPTISVPSVTAGENNYILTATITLNGVAMDKISNVYFDIVDGANSGNNTRQWAATITPNGDGTATATANFPKQGENLTDMGTVEYNFYASTSLIMKSYCTVANDCGVVASEEYTYTQTPVDGQSCPGTSTVTDHEGNVYNTVQIGDQCWTKENMRCTTSPSTGTYIVNKTSTEYTTHTGKMAKWYGNDSVAAVTAGYGLLYNWNAAVDTFNTAYGETSVNTSYSNAASVTFTGHRRGICPEGWHVPSHAEWTDLTNYLNTCRNEADPDQYKYRCDQHEGYIAKALASTTGWNTDEATEDYPCKLGYNPTTTNNASGFGAIPAGTFGGPSFGGADNNTYFWSATQRNSSGAYCRYLYYYSAIVDRDYYGKSYGYSVRCLKDATSGGGGGETPTTECPTFISNETELEASNSKYIALISYTGGSGNETVSGSYTVANDETQLVLGQTLFIDRTSKQVRVEIAQSAVSLNAGEDLLVEITLTDGTCTQSTATGVYTEPAEGDNCPQWGDVTETSFLVLNNNTVQLNLYGHNLADVQQEAFEVMLNGTTEQTFTSMEIGDAGDYIIFTGNQIVGVDYADATYRITYTPSQNCEQSSGLEVEGSFAICPYFVEATSITAISAYEFVVSTVYEKSGNIIIENGGYKVYTTPNLSTLVATVQMSPATQGVTVTADNNELIADVDLTDLITPEALALLDGQTLYIQPFLTSMECGTVTGDTMQYIVQNPTTDFTCGDNLITENNSYPTVKFGSQCWTAENMREVPVGATNGTDLTENNYSATNPFYYVKPNVDANVYGYYYNWPAANLVCPAGWHLPSDAEWKQMQEYVSNYMENGVYKYRCGGDSVNIARALASKTTDWNSNTTTTCAVGKTLDNNNETGFGAVPAGYYRFGVYNQSGYGAYFWSASAYEDNSAAFAWDRTMNYSQTSVHRYNDDKSYGYSVRCVMD